jgi:hypothetical protein
MILKRPGPIINEGFVFEPRYERFYLILVSAALLLTAFATCTNTEISRDNNWWVEMLVGLLFFNSLHTLITLIGLFALPELRSWLKSQLKPRRIAIFFVLIATIAIGSAIRSKSVKVDPVTKKTLATIFFILAAVHNKSQTMGLSLLYNRKIRPKLLPNEQLKQIQVEHTERILFRVMIATAVVGTFPMINLEKHFTTAAYALASLILFFALSIVANALRYPRIWNSNKIWFLSGVFIFAAWPLNPISVFAQRALHGIEYLLLADRAVLRSSIRVRPFTMICIFLILLTMATTFQLSFNLPFPKLAFLTPGVVSAILAVHIVIEYLHYYFDSLMFKFSDSDVRENIGSLF